jgi:multisubunit Na+/H+ antiporter MnhF subunit
MLSKAQFSTLNGLVIAALTALVSSGVISGKTVSVWQPVLAAVLAFVGTVAVRSARP